MDYHGVLQVRGIWGRDAVVMVIRGYIKVKQEWITMEYTGKRYMRERCCSHGNFKQNWWNMGCIQSKAAI